MGLRPQSCVHGSADQVPQKNVGSCEGVCSLGGSRSASSAFLEWEGSSATCSPTPGITTRRRKSLTPCRTSRTRPRWLCLAGTEIALDAFIEALTARKDQRDDRFCIWCHHRDEREARKFIRDAGA